MLRFAYLPLFAAILNMVQIQSVAAQTPAGPWVTLPTPSINNTSTSIGHLQLVAGNAVWCTKSTNGLGPGGYNQGVMASSDDGATWQYALIGSRANGQGVLSMSALDGQNAWLVLGTGLSTGALWRTATGPQGFVLAPAQVPGARLVHFFSATTGVVVSQPPAGTLGWVVYRTTDGGASWQQAAGLAGATAQAPEVSTTLGTHLWVGSSQGELLRTADAGQTWTTTPVSQSLALLSFRDAQHGLAYEPATNYPLYRTADGGTTWTPVTPTGPRRFSGLTALPGSTTYLSTGGYAYGDTNGAAISRDEGQTWLDLGGSLPLSTSAADATGRIFAGSTSGNLARYAGSPLASVSQSILMGTAYPNPTAGLLALPAGGAYRSARVYDASGRLCWSRALTANEETLDLSNLADGIYVLQLGNDKTPPARFRLQVAH